MGADAGTTAALALAQQEMFRHVVHRRLVEHPPARRALFVAPHADDIVLGCGGTLLRYRAAGVAARLVYLTDGRTAAAAPELEDAMAARRAAEEESVARALGLPPPELFGVDERAFTTPACEPELVARLGAVLDAFEPDAVFVPWMFDAHGDHRYANHLLARSLRARGRAPDVYGFEVWSFVPPGIVVDISAEMEEKRALVALYTSQLELFDYLAFTTEMGRLHAPLAGAGARFCEVFCPMEGSAYVERVLALDLASDASLAPRVLLTPPETLPR